MPLKSVILVLVSRRGHISAEMKLFIDSFVRLKHISLVRPPGTVVPGGLMFCCGFSFFFFCGTLRRYTSEMAEAIALKLSHMIGSVGT